MVLFDIHTHHKQNTQIKSNSFSSFSIFQILNTTPNEQGYTNKDLISCGIHPWFTENDLIQMEKLTKIVCNDNILAIGEAGLDKLRGDILGKQIEIFIKQVEISEKVNKPMIIHCVKAWDELLQIKNRIKPNQKWIIHGFRGKPELAKQLLKNGFYISIGEHFNKETLKAIPPDRLFLETDDSTKSIIDIYQEVEHCLNTNIVELVLQINDNFDKIFKFNRLKQSYI